MALCVIGYESKSSLCAIPLFKKNRYFCKDKQMVMRKLLLSLLAAVAVISACKPTPIIEDNPAPEDPALEVNNENLAGVWQMEKISLVYEEESGSQSVEASGDKAGYDTIIFNSDGTGFEYENGSSISFNYNIKDEGKALFIYNIRLSSGVIPPTSGPLELEVEVLSLSKTGLVMKSQEESGGQAVTQTITMTKIHEEHLTNLDLAGSWEDALGWVIVFNEDGTFSSSSGTQTRDYKIEDNQLALTYIESGTEPIKYTIALYDKDHMELWDKSSVLYRAARLMRVGSDSKKPWFQVQEEKIELEGISLDKPSITLKVGAKETLSVLFDPENVTEKPSVIWSSEDTEVATVADGVITAVSAGETLITAKAGGFTATCQVAVTPVEEISMEVAIDGDFSEWDRLTNLTADGHRYVYSELKDSQLTSLLRLKLTSDKDYIYVYTEIICENIFIADGGPYSQGNGIDGFLPNHPGTPGPLTVYIGSDNDSARAFATAVNWNGETFWKYTGFDSIHSYYFLWDSASLRMQLGWNVNLWPQNRNNWEDWMWGEPLYYYDEAWWWDGTHGTFEWDNTVSDENTFKFSGITTVKHPLSNDDVDVIRVEFAMNRKKLNEDGTPVSGNAVIGVLYMNLGNNATENDGTGKLPSSSRPVTLELR